MRLIVSYSHHPHLVMEEVHTIRFCDNETKMTLWADGQFWLIPTKQVIRIDDDAGADHPKIAISAIAERLGTLGG